MSLTLDFVEIDAKKQGAKVQVFLCSESGLKRLAWEFDIQPDAAKLVLESKEFLINSDMKYIDIKVCAEGQDRQVIGKISTSVNDLIEHHLIKPEEVMVLRQELGKVSTPESGTQTLSCSIVAKMTLDNFQGLRQT